MADTKRLSLFISSGAGTVMTVQATTDCTGTCATEILTGARISVRAVPAPGFIFTGWEGDCSDATDCGVQMSAARQVTARFAAVDPLSACTAPRSSNSTTHSVKAARLGQARRQLNAARPKLEETCDLRLAPRLDRPRAGDGLSPLPCSGLVTGHLFASGIEWSGPAGQIGAVYDLLYRPAWQGIFPVEVASRPLVVLVDHETHSSAEQFNALPGDNGRARVVGIPTAGAGCGTFADLGTTFTRPDTGA